jgi:hypothetical protein
MEIDQFQNEQFDMAQENTVEEQKEPQDEQIFEDVEDKTVERSEWGLQNIPTSQQNLAKLEEKIIEVMRREIIQVEWDKNTLNNILNTGYGVYKESVNTTEVIAKENHQVFFSIC